MNILFLGSTHLIYEKKIVFLYMSSQKTLMLKFIFIRRLLKVLWKIFMKMKAFFVKEFISLKVVFVYPSHQIYVEQKRHHLRMNKNRVIYLKLL